MNWIRRFFYGRNGIDALNIAVLFLIIALNILSTLFRLLPVIKYPVLAVFAFLQIAALGALTFRVLSRNIPARQRENAAFIRFADRARHLFPKQSYDRNYRFFKCPSCKLTLRVPKGKGKIFITCPQCGERFKKST